jgi:cell division protein ZapA
MTTKVTRTADRMVTLDVSLLGRDYKIACKEGEEAELKDAVALLDGRMREIREGGKSGSIERIAVMAALNLAHDFQHGRGLPAAEPAAVVPSPIIDAPAARRRIASMRSAIDQVLSGPENLS